MGHSARAAAEAGQCRGSAPGLHRGCSSRRARSAAGLCLALSRGVQTRSEATCPKTLGAHRVGARVPMPPRRQSWSCLCHAASPRPCPCSIPPRAPGLLPPLARTGTRRPHFVYPPHPGESPGLRGRTCLATHLERGPTWPTGRGTAGWATPHLPAPNRLAGCAPHNAGFVPGPGTSEGVSDTEKL